MKYAKSDNKVPYNAKTQDCQNDEDHLEIYYISLKIRGIELEPHPKQTPIVRFQSIAQAQPLSPTSSNRLPIDPLDLTLYVCVWSK